MRQIQAKTIASITISLLSFNALAATDEHGFSGSGELGYSNSTGNTVNTSFYGALKVGYTQEQYAIKSNIEANYKSENNVQTEERYIFDVQGNRYYSKDKSYYSFIGTRLEKNEFADIKLDTTVSVGLGRTLYKTDKTKLNGELGAGYQNTDYVTKNVKSDTQTVGIAKLDFKHAINDQVAFTQDLSVTSGENQTKVESNTGFNIKVGQQMNLKASYKYRHNDNPATGKKKTDTQTMLTLIYDF